MKKSSQEYSLIVNTALLCSAMIMAFSGLLIQISYHMGNHSGFRFDTAVFGVRYPGWSYIHRVSILLFSVSAVFHCALHWKWYQNIIRKKLFSNNLQTVSLSVVFILVAITGYIPWIIHELKDNENLRKSFIEIHDKLAIILFIYMILHLIKRIKWFAGALRKLQNKIRTWKQQPL